jgi:hypothetical protein
MALSSGASSTTNPNFEDEDRGERVGGGDGKGGDGGVR